MSKIKLVDNKKAIMLLYWRSSTQLMDQDWYQVIQKA